MNITISFLSGKGGSGKTTLALSMADLLCKCKIKTLLIDCDLSTNGATYFFETQLTDRNKGEAFDLYSFTDVLLTTKVDYVFPYEIDSYFHFFPSIPKLSDQRPIDGISWCSQSIKNQLRSFVTWARRNYDVILFDCQAGYTELLPLILPLMDVDLFILEADSISASAMRNLHLKIGNFLGHAKLYQIFNKATPEEFDIYSKIVGTFFTNIGTLLFDLKIRQAFSRSQIPDLENISIKYGSDLCEVCKIILPNKITHNKLTLFSDKLLIYQLEERRHQIEEKLYAPTSKSRFIQNIKLLWSISLSIILLLLPFVFILQKNGWFIRNYTFTNIILTFAFFVIATIPTSLSAITNSDFFNTHNEKRKYEHELKKLNKEITQMEYSQQISTHN